MTLDEYMRDVAQEMNRKSTSIRRDFATHRISAGTNREEIVAAFLREHLPQRFGVGTGLIISHNGVFSREADLIIYDRPNNSPLYPSIQKKLWPVEGIYALLEIKTQLTPRDLQDAIDKVRKFKSLERKFRITNVPQHISDSLAIIWSFDAPDPQTLKGNLHTACSSVPVSERPDFVVVPDSIVAKSGRYLELSKLGQENSTYRRNLQEQYGPDLSVLLPEIVEMDDLGENALVAWYIWFDSWLRQAGHRVGDLSNYLTNEYVFGKRI